MIYSLHDTYYIQLGGRGCNVDGTTVNNPIMRLTDQLVDTFLLPQSQVGLAHGGAYEEAALVSRAGNKQTNTHTQGHAQVSKNITDCALLSIFIDHASFYK